MKKINKERLPFPPDSTTTVYPPINIPSVWFPAQAPQWDRPCMFDNLPPGVYGLVCPCPRHGTWSMTSSGGTGNVTLSFWSGSTNPEVD